MSQLIAALQSGGSPLANIPNLQQLLQNFQQNRVGGGGTGYGGQPGITPAGAVSYSGAAGGNTFNPYDVVSQGQL